MSTIELLRTAGYVLSETTGVWARSAYGGIDYSDGDESENGLEEIIRGASDVSIFSPELAEACVDWPSRYHLSTERANILRPFAQALQSSTRVLEIGAGCGAITRYLGETGAQVLALEGSERRAGIARLRTRDLPNVDVLAERFQDFRTSIKFDVITLIGVLEYASVFTDEQAAALSMLRSVRQMLAPGGRLVIAIENKLGLKYLAGVPEDHLGQPMVGVEDRYTEGGARTFGRHEIDSLLADAGYSSRHFMVPVPDYKMPASILTERGATCNASKFDAGSLIAQAVRRDPQLTPTSFNLQRAWPVVSENRLAVDLANSFLIEAVTELSPSSSPEALAFHYSTQRQRHFARETLFIDRGDGQVIVRSSALHPAFEAESEASVRLQVQPESAYYHGELVVNDLREMLALPGWELNSVVDVVKSYLVDLAKVLRDEGLLVELDSFGAVLPDDYIDATPSNLIRTRNGGVVYIDREWSVNAPTLGWLLIRSLMFGFAGTSVAVSHDAQGLSLRDFILTVLERLDLQCSESAFDSCMQREFEFQQTVTGKDQAQTLEELLATHLLASSVATPAMEASADDRFSTIQHMLNLGAQHGVNMYLLIQSLHEALGEAQSRSVPALERIDARTAQLNLGQEALHDRLVATDGRLNEAVAYWSAQQAENSERLRSALEALLAHDPLRELKEKVVSLEQVQTSLLTELSRRPWWKRW
ncbi:class I SAM-dependent methyltransferase [Xanthomonas arboricola]|uniref:class I SAM-dependent methyltransferase n=1 Tax=Xanthomonas arboricola TaxID=56448 RepID=UPI000C8371CA|nr:class I SAM-dependent methyltransferase [Xanthomonas arboricola]